MNNISELKEFITRSLWEDDLKTLPAGKAHLYRFVRIIYVLTRDIFKGQLTLRAMSLVYTTLLSLVPLLALSFSVLKAFGVHDLIRPLLFNFLQPLGEKGIELGEHIIEFVNKVNVGVLGSVGLALLLYTVVSLIQKVEQAFNYIWHLVQERNFTQRFSSYLTVIMVGPVMVFTALGITASVMSNTLVQKVIAIEPLGAAVVVLGKLVPYVLVFGAFVFLYVFIPNTRVKISAGLIGALIAGFLWESMGWLFASFIVTSTKYELIYSSFAILIMFLIWIYLSWLILLIGASIVFYVQNPEYVRLKGGPVRLSNRMKEYLALIVMFLIAKHYHFNLSRWTGYGLVQRLGVPQEAMDSVLKPLQEQNLVLKNAEDPPAYFPGRDIETIQIKDILAAVRSAEEGPSLNPKRLTLEPPLGDLIESVEQSYEIMFQKRSLRDLILLKSNSDIFVRQNVKSTNGLS